MEIRRKEKDKDTYSQIYEEALHLIQRMAGNRWTDFNAHDPGVTLLDVFCYGLLDIEYRSGFDFTSYMPHDGAGNLDYDSWGLHVGEKLFGDAVISETDYARLVKDTVRGVRDCEVQWTTRGYRLVVVLESETPIEKAVSEIRALYGRHRNLGELLLAVQTAAGGLSNKTPDVKQTMATRVEDRIEKVTIPLQGYRYRSLQYDMPSTYGLGVEGILSGIEDKHRAHIYQLKGFMLLIDYLFSSADQQLRDISDLMGNRIYRPLHFEADVNIEGIHTLLDHAKANVTKVFQDESARAHRLAFAEMCCVMYGEDAREIKKLIAPNFGGDLLADRFVKIAGMLPEWQLNRARGMDITDPGSKDMPTVKSFLLSVLGNDRLSELSTDTRLKGMGIGIWEDARFFKRYGIAALIDALPPLGTVYKVPTIPVAIKTDTLNTLARGLPVVRTGSLPEFLLVFGVNLSNYRIVEHAGIYTLYVSSVGESKWLKLAQGTKGNEMIEYANMLSESLRIIRIRTYTFYLVEHILLATEEPAENPSKITVVMPTAWKIVYGQFELENWLRVRLPAHLELEFRWYGLAEFVRFETVYLKWKKAFGERKIQELADQSKRLLEWL